LEKKTHYNAPTSDEAELSANILATEASIVANVKQLTEYVRNEVSGVMEKVVAIQDAFIDVKNAANIKQYIERSPLKMLALSAVAGLFAGGILRSNRSSSSSLSMKAETPSIPTGPGIFSLLAIGILRPVLTEIIQEVTHRSLAPRKEAFRNETMNGRNPSDPVKH